MNRRLRVVNVYPFASDDRRLLDLVDPAIEVVHEGEDEPGWIDRLEDADVEVLSASYPPTSSGRTPRLRWLASAGAGVEYLVSFDPWARGIVVTNGSGLHAVAMAEYVIGSVMAVSERLEGRLANRHDRGWEDVRFELAGRRLRGRTMLVVGYGSVGRETARMASALGMRILAIKADPGRRADVGWSEPGTGDPDGALPERIEGPESIVAMAGDADYVVLTMPITARTAGIVSVEVLGAMRSDAWLVNVGRGAIIDEAALIVALRAGAIGGAVLDVFVAEPLPPDSPLWSLTNCIVTPHVSGLGGMDAFWHNAALLLAENLRREVAGEPLLNRTDPVAGY